MNFLRQIFHFHKWKTVVKKPMTTRRTSISYGVETEEEKTRNGFMVFQRCEVCGDEKAYLTDGTLIRNLEIEYSKSILGIE